LTVSILLKSFRVVLQLATEQTLVSFKSLDIITRVLKAACHQAQELQKFGNYPCSDAIVNGDCTQIKNIDGITENSLICRQLALSLFKDYVTISRDGRSLILQNADCVECLFDLFQEESLRKHVLEQVLALFRVTLYLSWIPVLLILLFTLGAKIWL
jgi:hypothetical protein